MGEKIAKKFEFSWLLYSVLFGAFIIRVFNLNYNSPFLDEAIYLILGKKFWAGMWHEVSESISWVGGFPFFYPPIAAAFYALGGIVTSRFFGVILGVASVYLIYRLTLELFPLANKKDAKIAGIVAAALMATSTIPIVLSRLVTYDAICVFLFLAGATTLTKAIFEGERNYYLAAAVFLFLAFIAKYIAALYIPFLLLLTLHLAFRTGSKYVMGGILASFWLPLLLLSTLFVAANFSSLFDFFMSKTSEEHDGVYDIIWSFFKYSPVIFGASLPSFYLLVKKKAGELAAFLAIGALMPLAAHLLAGESLSVYQHSVFALVFLLPVIGVAGSIFIDKLKMIGVFLVAFLIFLNFFFSIPNIKALDTFWPNTNKAAEFLLARISPSSRLLIESEDPVTLALWDKLPDENINGPFDFSYQGFEGGLAYLYAVREGYFEFIELDGTFFSKDIKGAIEGVIDQRYTLIFDDGSVKVWQRKD